MKIAAAVAEVGLLQSLGYASLTCLEYARRKPVSGPTVVCRVDLDEDAISESGHLAILLAGMQARASFFVRLHGEYDPSSPDAKAVLQMVVALGHELGYHSEVLDSATRLAEPPEVVLRRDLESLRHMFGDIRGVSSHRNYGPSGYGVSNLDFWHDHHPRDFGLVYEAYDQSDAFGLFYDAVYVSDSLGSWKCYRNGVLIDGDARSPAQHAVEDRPPLLYVLVHPEKES